MAKRFTVKTEARLDKAIADSTSLSRKRARRLVESGGVIVDGVQARFASQKIPGGSRVEVRTVPTGAPKTEIPERMKDEGLLVVDKPAGLPSQAPRGGGKNHLFGLLQAKYPQVALHHRLDTPASGLVLVTLKKGLNAAVHQMFKEHTIEREYEVVVIGEPDESGTWTGPIDGKPASTHFSRLASDGRMSLLSVKLETGRTHQIRRHAQEARHPIVGDRRYGGAASKIWPRLALHARWLRFEHPVTGEPVEVEAPIPEDLTELWAQVQ